MVKYFCMIGLLLLPGVWSFGAPGSFFSALSQNRSLCEKTDFLEPFRAIADFGLEQAVISAAVKIKFKNSSGENTCSSSRVSDTGHLLTASHCIEPCLRERLVIQKSPLIHGAPPTIERFAVSEKPVECLVEINGWQMRAKVIVANRCSVDASRTIAIESRAGLMKLNPEAVDCGEYGDLAILEVPANVLSGAKCLSMSEREATPNEEVAALGFPHKTDRRSFQNQNAANSDGESLYLSRGQIVRQDHCLSKSKDGLIKHQLSERLSLMAETRYQTTVDIVNSSSGSPLLDRSGAVIGVAESIAFSVHNKREECEGATYFAPVSRLKKNAKAWDSHVDISRIRCDRESALPTRSSI